VTLVPFARHVIARPGPRVELQIVEPAENTLPSKMQKFCTSAPVIWTVVVCAMPGAGIAIIIPDNTTTTAFLSIEALNVLSSGTFPHDGGLNAYLGLLFGSPGRIRTIDQPVNSRLLYR
jgi:hypothetical protein